MRSFIAFIADDDKQIQNVQKIMINIFFRNKINQKILIECSASFGFQIPNHPSPSDFAKLNYQINHVVPCCQSQIAVLHN